MPGVTAFAKTGSPVKLAGMSDAAMVRLRDGAELWTAVSGTGPPVALLHGGPGLWDCLAPLAALPDEAAVWRLNDPYPLPVSWEAEDPSLTGSWDVLVKLATAGAGWSGHATAGKWARSPEELAGAGNGGSFRPAGRAWRRLPDGPWRSAPQLPRAWPGRPRSEEGLIAALVVFPAATSSQMMS